MSSIFIKEEVDIPCEYTDTEPTNTTNNTFKQHISEEISIIPINRSAIHTETNSSNRNLSKSHGNPVDANLIVDYSNASKNSVLVRVNNNKLLLEKIKSLIDEFERTQIIQEKQQSTSSSKKKVNNKQIKPTKDVKSQNSQPGRKSKSLFSQIINNEICHTSENDQPTSVPHFPIFNRIKQKSQKPVSEVQSNLKNAKIILKRISPSTIKHYKSLRQDSPLRSKLQTDASPVASENAAFVQTKPSKSRSRPNAIFRSHNYPANKKGSVETKVKELKSAGLTSKNLPIKIEKPKQSLAAELITNNEVQSSKNQFGTAVICRNKHNENEDVDEDEEINVEDVDSDEDKTTIPVNNTPEKNDVKPSALNQSPQVPVISAEEKQERQLFDQAILKTLVRYCPKCDETKEEEVNSNKEFCRKCKAWLSYQCLKCFKRYDHFTSAKYHIRSKCNIQKVFKCKLCNYTTPFEYSLNRHESIHQFRCSNCKLLFDSEIALDEHYAKCAVEETLSCEYCPFETTFKRVFRNHVRRHATTVKEMKNKAKMKLQSGQISNSNKISLLTLFTRYCSYCDETVTNKEKNEKNCAKCQTEFVFQCKKCEVKKPSYSSIIYHLKNVCYCKVEQFNCPKCGKVFRSKDSIDKHSLNCGMKPNFFCEQCPFRTKFRQSFANHVQAHIQLSASIDESLNESISKKGLATLYNRYCSKCEKTIENRAFKNFSICEDCKTDLLFQCVECFQRFESYSQVVYHARNVCELRDHTHDCPKCGKKIENISRLRYHLKYCGKNETYFCDHCSYESKKKENLINHLKTHENKKIDNFKQQNWETNMSKFNRYCQTCDTFTANSAFRNEKFCEKCKSQLILQCLKCEKQTNNHTSMIYHVTNSCKVYMEEKPTLECELCTFETKGDITMKKHAEKHDNILVDGFKDEIEDLKNKCNPKTIRRYCGKCNICVTPKNEPVEVYIGERYCSQCNLQMIYGCKRCNKLCTTYDMMVYHSEKTCQADKEFPCSECNYVASWSEALKKHKLFKHTYIDPANYLKCNICNKAFRLLPLLKLHQRCCNTQPKFLCDQCPFKSRYKKTIENHKKRHLTGMVVKRGFYTKSNSFKKMKKKKLSEQDRIKSCIKSICPRCEKQRLLVRCRTKCHVCTASLQFECKKCDFKSSTVKILYAHVTQNHIASNAATNTCRSCNKTFADINNLKMHENTCKNDVKLPVEAMEAD